MNNFASRDVPETWEESSFAQGDLTHWTSIEIQEHAHFGDTDYGGYINRPHLMYGDFAVGMTEEGDLFAGQR